MTQDPDDLETLAEKGRDARAAEAARLDRAQAEEASAAALVVRARPRRAAWRTSPLAHLLTFNLAIRLVYLTVWVMTLLMAAPYFVYFATRETVHGWGRGGPWVLDPSRDGFGLFYVFVVTSLPLIAWVAAYPFARRQARATYTREVAWVAQLPFPVVGYPDALGTDRSWVALTLRFHDHAPDADRVSNVVAGLDPRLSYEAQGHTGRVRFEAGGALGYRDFQVLHRLLAMVLSPLHLEAPIERLEFED